MSCADARLKMDDAIEEGLPPDLGEHLDGCEDCREQWQQLEAVEQRLQAARPIEPPAHFVQQVLARVDLVESQPASAAQVPAILPAPRPLMRSSAPAGGESWWRPELSMGAVIQLAAAGLLILTLGALSRLVAIGLGRPVPVAPPLPPAALLPLLSQLGQGLVGLLLTLCLAAAMAGLWFGILVLPRTLVTPDLAKG